MNEFTINVLVLGLPGIICEFLCRKLIGQRSQRTTIETVLRVFLFSILSYTLVCVLDATLSAAYGLGFQSGVIGVFLTNKPKVEVGLLIQAVCAGVLLAYILSYCVHYNLLNLIGQKIRATGRYGDEDVWDFFHNSRDSEKDTGWVMVRDLKADLACYCYISTWSDMGMERELVLTDASVYRNSTGEYLYEARHIYLSRNKDDIMIEVPPANAKEIPGYSKAKQSEEANHERGENPPTEGRRREERRKQQAAEDAKAGH